LVPADQDYSLLEFVSVVRSQDFGHLSSAITEKDHRG
jgi:hypothetical protein